MRLMLLGAVLMAGCARPGVEVTINPYVSPPRQSKEVYERNKALADLNDQQAEKMMREAKTDEERKSAQALKDFNDTARKYNEINKR